jgi:hypothetical protein
MVMADFGTSDATATTADNDYEAKAGIVKIKPHRKSKSIKVTVNGDDTHENAETFNVDLSDPHGASIDDGHAIGTITDNDPGPLALEDFSTTLSNGCIDQGQTDYPVGTVTLNSPATSDTFVTVTSDGSAATITGGGVTVPTGMDSAPVKATGVSGPADVTLTATLGTSLLTAPLHVASVASPCP